MADGLGPSVCEGEVLGAKYRLERELGRGAMGTVWAATHLTLEQRVAIKFIAPEHANSLEARLRFRTEARAAAHLKSRYVVQVYDDGETMEGTPYIVMQYLEGETVEQRIEREGTIPLLEAVRITGHVTRALRRAHARGIVHRDLKPANIYLCRSDEDEHGWIAKVLDFGVAKVEGFAGAATTNPGAMLGTPLFMSPEQVKRASLVDHRADLYSLGMCFFNMVTGRHAFEDESFGSVLVAICSEPLPNLAEISPALSPQVVSWFERCCARLPEQRFQSADEAFAALRDAVEGADCGGRFSNLDQETLLGHRAPLSQRSPPLGTTDSLSYPGAEGISSQQPKRRRKINLGLAFTSLAFLGMLSALVVDAILPRPEAPLPLVARAAALRAQPSSPIADLPVAPEPARVAPPTMSGEAPRRATSAQGFPAKPARSAASASTPIRKAAPARRPVTDLGF